MKICILLRSFERGGAEHQAAITAAELVRRGHDVRVVVFRQADAHRDVLASAGLTPTVLSGRRPTLALELGRWIAAHRPDVVLSYLAGPNLLALVSRLRRDRPVLLWGVRSSTLHLADETRLGRIVYRTEPRLSRFCDLAVANSHQGRSDAVARGFRPPLFEVVPNGIDTDRWRPTPELAEACRTRLDLPRGRPVIGCVGRIHPMKGLPVLLRAMAGSGSEAGPRPIDLAVVGGGESGYVDTLRDEADRLDLGSRVHWLGPSSDLSQVYPALDLVVSASTYGEGFSNVIGEALSCGIPCIGTDVGDTARLIGDRRFVIAPGDPRALSDAITAWLRMPLDERRLVGEAGRDRMVESYGVRALGSRLEQVMAEALTSTGRR